MDKYVVIRGNVEIVTNYGPFGDTFESQETPSFFLKDDAALTAAMEAKYIREDDLIVEIKSLRKAVTTTLKLVDSEKKEAK